MLGVGNQVVAMFQWLCFFLTSCFVRAPSSAPPPSSGGSIRGVAAGEQRDAEGGGGEAAGPEGGEEAAGRAVLPRADDHHHHQGLPGPRPQGPYPALPPSHPHAPPPSSNGPLIHPTIPRHTTDTVQATNTHRLRGTRFLSVVGERSVPYWQKGERQRQGGGAVGGGGANTMFRPEQDVLAMATVPLSGGGNRGDPPTIDGRFFVAAPSSAIVRIPSAPIPGASE